VIEKITVNTLVDNGLYDKRLKSEFGYSLLIEYGKEKILFDTGYSNLFLQNAKKMAIDLNTINSVVVSHRHKSRSGGLPHLVRILKNKTDFLIEPRYFDKFSKKLGNKIAPGFIDHIDILKTYLENHNMIIINKREYKYKDGIYFFLPYDSQEGRYPLNKYNIRNALVMLMETQVGIFLFLGAAHSRFSMVLDWFAERFPEKEIETVFGGININFKRQRDVEIVKNSMKKVKINNFQLSHCSSIKEYEFLKEITHNVYFNGSGKILKYS